MLPILLGAIFGYIVAIPFGLVSFAQCCQMPPGYEMPKFTFPAFTNPAAWGMASQHRADLHCHDPRKHRPPLSDEPVHRCAGKGTGREPLEIKKLIGLNLIADGADDIVVGMLGGCAGTNYGENNSLMAITRNYSTAVLMTAGVMAILLGFFGKLVAVVNTMPVAVVGGLSIYLFGVIGMQGVALIQSEKVNLFDPKQLAVGAIILVTGIGGNLGSAEWHVPLPDPRSSSPTASRRSCSPPLSASC